MTHLAEENLADLTLATGRRDALFVAHPVPSLLFDCNYLVIAANTAARTAVPLRGASAIEGLDMVIFFPELGSSLRATRQVTVMRNVAVHGPMAATSSHACSSWRQARAMPRCSPRSRI